MYFRDNSISKGVNMGKDIAMTPKFAGTEGAWDAQWM
jgi:hypothetical protein